ncbi:MAG: hypothetical protein ACON4P_07805, partial [Candidatus Puniceispirillales bacterium]
HSAECIRAALSASQELEEINKFAVHHIYSKMDEQEEKCIAATTYKDEKLEDAHKFKWEFR